MIVDNEVVLQCEKLGYSSEKVREWLLSSELNNATTTYFLLMGRKVATCLEGDTTQNKEPTPSASAAH